MRREVDPRCDGAGSCASRFTRWTTATVSGNAVANATKNALCNFWSAESPLCAQARISSSQLGRFFHLACWTRSDEP